MPVISKITGAPFRFWCQKVLPAVYDDSLSYYELLCKVVDYLNKVMEDDINVVNLVNELEEFVNNYFNNLDVQEEINNKLDAMAEDGSLLAVVAPHLDEIIAQYEATLDADLAEYKEEVGEDITQFKNDVNSDFSAFSLSVTGRLNAQDTDIESFKGAVNTELSEQDAEIASFKSGVSDSVATQESNISVMQSQMSNFIESHSGELTFTELYNTTEALGAHYVNETFTLSDDYTKYNELDIYWSYNGVQRCTRVKASDLLATGVEISFYADEAVSASNVAPMFFPFMKIVNGNTAHTQLKIDSAYSERWSGASADSATRNIASSAADYSAGSIIKVVGVSYQLDAEVLDIRVGGNYKIYANAGDAVRGQFDLATICNKVEFPLSGFIFSDGALYSNTSYSATDYIECDENTVICMYNISTGNSAYAYTFYDEKYNIIDHYNNVSGDVIINNVPANTKYIRLCSESDTHNPSAYLFTEKSTYYSITKHLKDLEFGSIEPKNTTFFGGINYLNLDDCIVYNDRFVDTEGVMHSNNSVTSIAIPVKPNTRYTIYIPHSDRGIVAENTVLTYSVPGTYTVLYNAGHREDEKIEFTTGSTANSVLVYFCNSIYDISTYGDSIVLNEGDFTGDVPYVKPEYLGMPKPLLKDKNILIFGDSITDCCTIGINSVKQTTSYAWKNPSNSYVNGQGQTVAYSMWPKILKENQPTGEIRNYAYSGASYRTRDREAGNERQNLQYQIDVAMNDLNNPYNVFSVDNYVPDIVIFALGTNDGAPADTYESAMQATVYDGVSINTQATITALDDTKTIASARKAFMRVKQAFPMAQIYCVLPIQRADNDVNLGALHSNLKEMAQRYGCIIIDGAFDSGITRDFNVWNSLGTYLKDGLHPNEKGQNLMARMIITSLLSHYTDFGIGFNQ